MFYASWQYYLILLLDACMQLPKLLTCSIVLLLSPQDQLYHIPCVSSSLCKINKSTASMPLAAPLIVTEGSSQWSAAVVCVALHGYTAVIPSAGIRSSLGVISAHGTRVHRPVDSSMPKVHSKPQPSVIYHNRGHTFSKQGFQDKLQSRRTDMQPVLSSDGASWPVCCPCICLQEAFKMEIQLGWKRCHGISHTHHSPAGIFLTQLQSQSLIQL